MKKIACGLLCVLLLLAAGGFAAHAANAQSNGLDVVIVLDSSRSMNMGDSRDERAVSSDPDYIRLDAAMIMINMCEITRSNVAVVPFSEQLLQGEGMLWHRLLPVHSGIGSYRKLLSDEIMAFRKVGYSTDMGIGMMKAVEILDAREDASNDALILLLCDGAISASNNSPYMNQQVSYVERRGDGTMVTHENQRLDTLPKINAYIKSLVYDTIEIAEEKNYTIYTIALENKTGSRDTIDYSLLIEMARRTGGLSFNLSSADELPTFFSEIFADAIGSMLQKVDIKYESGQCAILVPIPNSSVVEANVLIPRSAITGPVRVLNPDGEPAIENVLSYEYSEHRTSSKYLHLKIVGPWSGDWRIEFQPSDSLHEGELDSLSFDMLYNYSIELAATIGQQYKKNDTLRMEAYFVDKDGEPSADTALYQHGIHAWVTFMQNGVQLAQPVQMTRLEDRFVLEATPLALGILRSGEITAQIHAEGDYLVRDLEEPLTFTISNRAPVLMGPAFPSARTLVANKVLSENPDAPDQIHLDFAASFSDPDDEPITLKYNAEELGGIVDITQSGMVLTIATNGAAGEGSLEIWAEDSESESERRRIDIRVESDLEKARQAIGVSLSIIGGERQEKEGDVTIAYQLTDKATGAPLAPELAAAYYEKLDLRLSVAQQEGPAQAPAAAYNPAENRMEAVYRTGSLSGQFEVEAEGAVNRLGFAPETASFRVGNAAPVLAHTGELAPGPLYIDRVLADNPDEPDTLTVDFSAYFEDADDTTLSLHQDAEDALSLLDIEQDGMKLTFATKGVSGSCSMAVWAEDQEASSDLLRINLEVVSEVVPTAAKIGPAISVVGGPEQGKGSEVIIAYQLMDLEKNTPLPSEGALPYYERMAVSLTVTPEKGEEEALSPVYNPETNRMEAVYRTGCVSDVFAITGHAEINRLVFDPATGAFSVINQAPRLAEPDEEPLSQAYWVSVLLPVREETPPRSIALRELFTDDLGDTLTYSFHLEPEDSKTITLAMDEEQHVLTISPASHGKALLVLRATDADEASFEVAVDITVTSWVIYWAIRLALALAVLLLLLLLRQALKPAWKGQEFSCEVDDNYEGNTALPGRGKSPIKATDERFMPASAREHLQQRSETLDQALEQVRVLPAGNRAVKVKMKKRPAGVVVAVNGLEIKKRSFPWRSGTLTFTDATEQDQPASITWIYEDDEDDSYDA